jgi:peptidoglycan/xylan/chitin deacetylase (PgdA/CDA1 family)
MTSRAFLVIAVLTACTDPSIPVAESTQAAVAGSTVISLTFDDTFADNFQVGALAEARGMRATFFVNSGRIGQAGSLSLDQLIALRDQGHEIGGHTITHARLAEIPVDDARRQICDDRSSFLENGFRVTSFAYPFSSQNATVRQIAADCGYNSARLVGGLVVPTSCSGCPYANPMPPVDPFGVRTNDSIDETTTLDLMKLYVTQAEQHGGGWVPMVFHHVCDGCDSLAVSPATLATFLDWLAARAPQGTVVATVDQVMGGDVKPAVPGPLPAPVGPNMLQNASLETDANSDQVPDCWQRGGSGTNSGTYTLTTNAFEGARAQRIDVTSFSSGARRLVSRQDSGACAPAITPGHRYTVSARYIATSQPIFSVYYRNSSGSWIWFAQSARLPTSSSYALGTYTTPAMPAGATAISVGLSLVAVGSLTMDAYSLLDADGSSTDTTAPSVALTMPSSGATVNSGIVQVAANATDASGVARVEFLANGTVVATDTTNPYWISWNAASYAGQRVTLSARAVDTRGNSATSSTRQVTVGSAADTTAPTVALTSPAAGATVSGSVAVTATASDAGGIARVELYANAALIGTDVNAPYAFDWNTAAYAGTTVTLVARAVDAAGNTADSASTQVTVAAAQDTTPPTVALTSPADGATVSGTVQLSADASDAGGIARVEFYAGSTLIATELDSPYALDWDTTPYAGTTVTLVARAYDTAGNTADSASRQVTVSGAADTTPPTVALTSHADGATVTGTVRVAADAADAGGIARVELYAGSTLIATELTAPYEIDWDTAPYAGTTVTLVARAFDNAGNTATSASRQVSVAAAAPTNLVQNPSLEINANGDQVPDCWQRGGSGTNAATFTLTTNAFTGSVAQRIDMTSYSSGARRIVTLQDAGTCAPAASAGRRYTVTGHYISNTQPVFTIYYRNASGTWVFFAQSPALPASSTYRLGSYTTAPLPSGATAISVGLSIIRLGSLTMDDFTLVDAGT